MKKISNKLFKNILCFIVFSMLVLSFKTAVFAEESDMINTSKYISENINTNYTNVNKFDVVDVLAVKQTLADGSKLTAGKSLQDMYSSTPEAFLVMDEFYVAMYDLDENSQYYVAYVDTMHNDSHSRIAEVDFAYTNLDGQAITDAIFDEQTGIAYIPKYYTQENKNGKGILNVQIQLLQVCDSENPTTTIKTIVEKSGDIKGSTIESGYLEMNALDTEVNISIANDTIAKQNISADDIIIEKNGFKTTDYTYNSITGIVTLNTTPTSIDTLEISIDKNNYSGAVDPNYDIMPLASDGPVDANGADLGNVVWKASDDPEVGSTIRLDNVRLIYHAGEDNRHLEEQENPAYSINHAQSADMEAIVNAIKNDNPLLYNNLVSATWYMSWECIFPQDTTINYGNVQLTIPKDTVYNLKCAHGIRSFDTITGNILETNTIELKVFEVNKEKKYLIVGMLAPYSHSQSGASVFKIAYETAPKYGSLTVGKKEKDTGNGYNDFLGGATFRINGPSLKNEEWTSVAGQTKKYENLIPGRYVVEEIDPPTGMVRKVTPLEVDVESNKNVDAFIENVYQRGSVTLVKYDEDSEKPRGNVKLEGAIYELHAAQDISEGNHPIYSKDQLVEGNIVTGKNGETKVIENLPIGKYYYKEIKAAPGFKLNTDLVEATVKANSSDQVNAINDSVRAPESEIKVNLGIKKYISETDYDAKETLPKCQFKLTLINVDESGNEYYDDTQTYTSGETDENGEASINNIVYGKYLLHEVKCNEKALPAEDRVVDFTKDATDGKVYKIEIEDKSKTIQIKVIKRIEDIVDGKTDAKVSGAYFKVYLDAACTQPYVDKNGVEVVLGPTDNNGNVTSGKMRTRNYYLKETVFPEGMNPDAIVPEEFLAKYGNNIIIPENKSDRTYKNIIYKFENNVTEQTTENELKERIIKNIPDTGRVIIVKFDNQDGTDEKPAEGAKVRLTLKSNTSVHYDCTVSKYGTCEFENEDVKKYYYKDVKTAYTIPYGKYLISEQRESDDGQTLDWFFIGQEIEVVEQDTTKVSLHADMDVEFMLKLVKCDEESKEKIALAGAKYMVWDVQNNCFIKQRLHSGEHEEIDEFETNNKGQLILPDPLKAGEYVIYETQAPEGYYLNDEYRLPLKDKNSTSMDKENIDMTKVGNASFGGIYIKVTKEQLEIAMDQEYPTNPVEELTYILDHLVYEQDIYNKPLKGKLDLYKEGEMFTNVKQNTSEYPETEFADTLEETAPVYEMRPLKDVKFEVVAKEDIRTKDGRLQEAKGTKHTLKTKADGHGRCTVMENGVEVEEELYCGTYTVTEVETPAGYEPCEPFEVTIENKDQYERVKILNKDAENKYVPTSINFEKIFEKDKDGVSYRAEFEDEEDKEEERPYAVFGIYNKNELKTVSGNLTIPADTLIQSFVVYDGDPYKQTMKLPDGEYYFEELYVKGPWIMYDEEGEPRRYDFTINHKKGETDPIDVNVKASNPYTATDLYLLKISKTDVLQAAGIILTNTQEDDARIKEALNVYSNSVTEKLNDRKEEVTVEDVLEEVKDNNVRVLSTGEFEVYVDEECTNHLQVSKDNGNTYKNVVLKSEVKIDEKGEEYNTGVYSLNGIPEGMYYIKETKAPIYIDLDGNVYEYKIEEEPLYIEAMEDALVDKENILFRVFPDGGPTTPVMKQDIFTGKPVPGCLFTITDEKGTELIRFLTPEDGIAEIPTDKFKSGEYYYFTELSVNDNKFYYEDGELYELNTKPHKFRAEYDKENREWKFYGRNEDEDGNEYGEEVEKSIIFNRRPTGDFEITKLDAMDSTVVPHCKFELKSLETNWSETGVTDENGIYVFKNIPYGEYVYTEIEAPEGYDIDTTPHYITIDTEHTKAVVTDVRTGDIAVVAIAVLAVVCVVGIVFVIVKNKKSKSTK